MSASETNAGRPARRAVTLVELLVVVAIIAVVLALLVPALLAGREAARRLTCLSNLRQLALASLAHEQTRGFLPTGGWGGDWVGDPDRGFGPRQPGGWAFAILPHIEETAARDMGAGLAAAAAKADRIALRLATPVSLFTCPTRRAAKTWPLAPTQAAFNMTAIPDTVTRRPPRVVRGDYAANMGSGRTPYEYRSGGSFSPAWYADMLGDLDWTRTFGPPTDGVIFRRSRTRLAEITDGLTQTYLLGEKYVDPAQLETGTSEDDSRCLYSGHDRDVLRAGCVPPYRDRAGFDPRQIHGGNPPPLAFGSGHADACGMAMADGSVQPVAYAIDPEVHSLRASRNDGRRP